MIFIFQSDNVKPKIDGEELGSYFSQTYLPIREYNPPGWKSKTAF